MTAPTELLPCPFCGQGAKIAPDEIGSGGQHVPPYHAGCFRGGGCGIVFTADDPDEAASEWNRRASHVQAKVRELLNDGLEILVNLTDSIAKHGNYSPEATCTFIDQAGSAFREALRALPASEAGWRPIETVPEDDTLFLAYCPPDDEFPDGRTMIWKGSIFAYQKKPTPRHLQFPATHWMPLPSAPDRRPA